MIRTLIIVGIAIITLSQCDSGMNAGAPKQNTVVVKTDNTPVVEKEEVVSTSSMSPSQIDKAKSIIAAASPDKIAGINAKRVFKNKCATCHGFTGNLGVNGAKDLTASVISLEEAIAQVYFGKGLMTPFKGLLSDEEIVAVSKYTETLRK